MPGSSPRSNGTTPRCRKAAPSVKNRESRSGPARIPYAWQIWWTSGLMSTVVFLSIQEPSDTFLRRTFLYCRAAGEEMTGRAFHWAGALLLASLPQSGYGADPGLVTLPSKYSVQETIERFE